MAMAATMPITYEKMPRLTKFRKKKTPPPKTVTRMIVSIDSRLFLGAGSMIASELLAVAKVHQSLYSVQGYASEGKKMTYRNLAELLSRQADRMGPRPAMRFKRNGLYHDLSWHDYAVQVQACAAGLMEQGIVQGDRVGLLSENRLEWLLADMGILAAGAVNVPPHAPLTAQQVHYQLADAEVHWLFVSTAKQLDKIRCVRGQLPLLTGVVVFDDSAAAKDAMSWTEFLAIGRQAL